jgi:acyl-CoA thioesterase I
MTDQRTGSRPYDPQRTNLEPATGASRLVTAFVGMAVGLLVAGCANQVASTPGPSPAVAAPGSPAPTSARAGVRYVALGDSYTIGTGVTADERFPNQLVAALRPDLADLELVANLGVNGYTSADLIRDELPQVAGLAPDLVTVLIGVNDAVQRVPAETYEANVVSILDALLGQLAPARIVTVAIPDYTVTPSGAAFGDPRQQHDAIATNNQIMARLAAERGIAFVDIFDISLVAADDPSLVADDGLHPSGAQYARWVDRIAPVVRQALGG